MNPPAPDEALPLVSRFLPGLPEDRLALLARLVSLVRAHNEGLNLVSRRDVDHLEEHHLLHSLALARVWRPAAGATIADLGTGGGFPGLPLAVLYPECRFTLVDSIAKKGRALESMVAELGLANARVRVTRAETLRERFDFVLGRAVAALPVFLGWAAPLVRPGSAGTPANGVFYFKGTRYHEEIAGLRCRPAEVWALDALFPERPYFAEKFLLHFTAPVQP